MDSHSIFAKESHAGLQLRLGWLHDCGGDSQGRKAKEAPFEIMRIHVFNIWGPM